MNNKNKDLRKILRVIMNKQRFWGNNHLLGGPTLDKDILDDFPFFEKKHLETSFLISAISFALIAIVSFATGGIISAIMGFYEPASMVVMVIVSIIAIPLNFYLLYQIPSYIYLYKKYKDSDLKGFTWQIYLDNKFDPYDKHW
ncbi:MAG: hypothetical protein FWB93_00865 [Oscillospiraceae bacterium]|nr:hypothetical protein [Oscillospiraceae bacterium]